ncbi:MAG: LptF/LptG family permease [Treponema sp.]|nr:LptF/LptG family permease [Treponema sp.]
MRVLDKYLVRQFFPFFLIAVAMFVLLITLIDLFAHIVRYLNNEVSAQDIFRASFYFLPQAFSYALPVSLLFASAYTLGDLYSRNELTSVFAAGVPFSRFSMPLLVIGFAASLFSFFFDDLAVVPTMRMKNELTNRLLNLQGPETRSDIVIRARQGQLLYAVDFFDSQLEILNGVNIIEQDAQGQFVSLIRAPQAVWNNYHWAFVNPVIYEWYGGLLHFRPLESTNEFRETPDIFRRNMVNPEELRVRDARLLIGDLREAGLPVVNALANYYHRFSFATVPFVVMILSISMAGRFKKNILLMSLLASLGVAVVFYVTEMISMMLAQSGHIYPLIGAWFPVLLFVAIGLFLLRSAKT